MTDIIAEDEIIAENGVVTTDIEGLDETKVVALGPMDAAFDRSMRTGEPLYVNTTHVRKDTCTIHEVVKEFDEQFVTLYHGGSGDRGAIIVNRDQITDVRFAWSD